MARRQVTIYVNGKEVENSIKNVNKEMQVLKRTMRENEIGSEKYEQAVKRYNQLSPIIEEHKKRLGGIESSWKSVTQGATKFLGVAGIAFGAAEIIGYGKQLYQTGVNMDSLARKAETVLGASLSTVAEAARDNAEAMGLTNSQYVEAVTNVADLLKPMGFTTEAAAKQSIEIQNLSGALSQWSNGKFNAIETTESLRKALLGEREELERYGVSIKQAEVNSALAAKGLDKLTGNSLKQAEAMVTLELITQKSADAIRGYEVNTDSAARRQAAFTARISEIQENIATGLAPIFDGLVSIMNDYLGVADKGSEKTAELQAEFNAEIETLKRGNLSQEQRKVLIDEINTRYGKYLPNLITEKTTLDELTILQNAANKAFEQKITLLATEEQFVEISKKLNAAKREELELEKNLSLIQQRAAKGGIGFALTAGGNPIPFIESSLAANKKAQEELRAEMDLTMKAAQELGLDLAKSLSGGTATGNGAPEYDKDKLAKEQKKAEKDRLAALEEGLKAEALLLENQRINKLLTEQQYQEQLYQLEKEGIVKRLQLLQQFGEERTSKALELQNELDTIRQYEAERATSADEAEIQRIQEVGIQKLDIRQVLAESEKESWKAVNEYLKKTDEEYLKSYLEHTAKQEEAARELKEKQAEITVAAFDSLAVATAEFFAGQKDDQRVFLKDILNTLLSALQKSIIANIAGATAVEAGTKPFPANLLTTGLKIAAINAAFAAAKVAISSFGQRKHGGFATVRGADDGQLYHAKLIGQPMTGLLNHPHPVLTSSGILANEVGKEYYVSHTDLRNPRILDHVRAIENITSHRQRATGGFASAAPTQNVAAPAGATTDPELKQLLMMNAQFLAKLIAEGVRTEHTYDDLAAIKKGIAKLDKASGGRL